VTIDSATQDAAGLDPAALERMVSALRREPGFDDARLDGPPEVIQGGFWASTSRLRLTGVEPALSALVLRVMPDDALAVKETIVHRGVAAQSYPTPTVRLVGDRDFGLGGPFILMDFAPGEPLLADLEGPAALGRLPRIARTLPDRLADAMASLHRLDPEPIAHELRDADARSPIDTDGVLAQLLAGATRSGDHRLLATARWLEDHRPPTEQVVVCHGDLHPFNMLTDHDRWCVLDWTAAVIAHPAYDLAYTQFLVANPPLVVPGPLRPLIGAAGRNLGRRFLRAYRTHSGAVVDTTLLDWYTTMHALRFALDLDTWQRAGTLDQHKGHPVTALAPAIRMILDRRGGSISA
jgi:aminoglycoside phosphotransferase (APT) family kinase protein